MDHANMDDPSENTTDAAHSAERRAPIGRLRPAARVPQQDHLPLAGTLAGQNFVSLPPWFSTAQAHAVLRLKGKPFALVSDAKGAQGVAHAEDLAVAPPHKSLTWCLTALGPGVADVTPVDEALRILDHHEASYVPVVLGGVMLGVLSRDAALEALASASGPRVDARLAA